MKSLEWSEKSSIPIEKLDIYVWENLAEYFPCDGWRDLYKRTKLKYS